MENFGVGKILAIIAAVSKNTVLITVDDDKLTSAAMYITSSSAQRSLFLVLKPQQLA